MAAPSKQHLIFEDSQGRVLRQFPWTGEQATVIRRQDTRRLEVVLGTKYLDSQRIAYQKIADITPETLSQKPFLVGQIGHLRIVEDIEKTTKDPESRKEDEKPWYLALVATMVLAVVGFFLLSLRTPLNTEKLEAELQQQVVKIMKRTPPQVQKTVTQTMNRNQAVPTETKATKNTESVKRLGALAVLGSLKSGKQQGGVNLNAAAATAGPGLGGTGGSGGTQTSLYGKGILSAPMGAGAQVSGSGGYGTKGKGGGQAGYGKLSMIGSSGGMPVPLGAEATAEKGLEMDQIAAVIQQNLGQIRFCYEQGLQLEPSLNGRVGVDFTIGANGLVKAASIGSTSLNAKSVEDCVVMRLKSWKFPLPQGGVEVKVSYPFVLRRVGQG